MKKYRIIILCVAILLALGYMYKQNKKQKTLTTPSTEKEIIIDDSRHLDWENFKRLASHLNTETIDIRTASEIAQGKLFDEALEIDFYKKDFEEQIKKLSKTKIYLIYCRSGNRSLKALKIMRKNGITAYDLTGGITNPDIMQ